MSKAEAEQETFQLSQSKSFSSPALRNNFSSKEMVELKNKFPFLNTRENLFSDVYQDVLTRPYNKNRYVPRETLDLPGKKKGTYDFVDIPQADFREEDLFWILAQIKLSFKPYRKAKNDLILNDEVYLQLNVKEITEELIQEKCPEELHERVRINPDDLFEMDPNFASSIKTFCQYHNDALFDHVGTKGQVYQLLPLAAIEVIASSKENIVIARSGNIEKHIRLGQAIENRIFEERQILNRMAIHFLKDSIEDYTLSLAKSKNQTRDFKQDYLKAKISLHQAPTPLAQAILKN